MKTTNNTKRYRIRKGGFEGLYLDSQGFWGPWAKARRCSSQASAEAFADAHNLYDFGVFATKCVLDKGN